MRRLILTLFFGLLMASPGWADPIRVVTWNMEWFPGGSPTSSELQRILHMSAAKEALHQMQPDVFAAQEIRDWDSFAEVASVLPNLVPLVVSRYRDSPVGGA